MNNTILTKTSESYWAIFNELLKVKETGPGPESLRALLGTSSERILLEYCVLGFTTPRQSGKTRWICDFLNKYQNAICVVTNINFRNELRVEKSILGEELPYLDEVAISRVYTVREMVDFYTTQNYPESLKTADYIVLDETQHVYNRPGFSRDAFAKIITASRETFPIVVEIN